jgi:hypothetical protein
VEPAVDFSKVDDVFVVGTDVVRAIEIKTP